MTSTPEDPVVSVVIPAYNAAWCVGKAITSVLDQHFRDFEIIVVDDGSTDDTANILASYGDAIRVVTKSNGGLSSARNAGIRQARGLYVAFLDSDDLWLPGKLVRQVELMEACRDIGFCSTAAQVEDPEGRPLNIWECPNVQADLLGHLFHQNAAVAGSGSGVMVRRELLDQVGGFDESLKCLEDIDMWMRLAAVTNYRCIPEALTVVVKRPDSMSRDLEAMRDAAVAVMRKNRHLLPPALRGPHWRAGMAGVHADYAKWRYRQGNTGGALLGVLGVLALAPVRCGRLAIGLLRDILLARPL